MIKASYCKQCNNLFYGVPQRRYCSLSCKQRRDYEQNTEARVESVLQADRAKPLEQTLWISARNRCLRSGVDFTISVEDIPAPPVICPISGVTMSRNEGSPQFNSPTLDRIDNTKGYIPGNVRVISYGANRWKSNMTLEDIRRLYEYSRGEI